MGAGHQSMGTHGTYSSALKEKNRKKRCRWHHARWSTTVDPQVPDLGMVLRLLIRKRPDFSKVHFCSQSQCPPTREKQITNYGPGHTEGYGDGRQPKRRSSTQVSKTVQASPGLPYLYLAREKTPPDFWWEALCS